MEKRERQRQRVREYFLEAAKELVLEEGTKQLTARKIAQRAGYSYATIYNYFDSLDHLLLQVTLEWLKELGGRLEQRIQGPLETAQDLQEFLWAYPQFYLENPNIFSFFFYDRRGIPEPALARQLEEVNFSTLLARGLMPYIEREEIREDELETIGETITYYIHGMLLMNLADGKPAQIDEMKQSLDRLVRYILK